MTISKILIALDHTESAQHAMAQASMLARSEKSQVVLLSVVPPYEGDLRIMGKTRALREMRIPFKEALESAEQTARKFGLRSKSIFDEGDPYSLILSSAERENVDLIVMNWDWSNPANMLPFGAILGKVIGQSKNDVLVIPDKASLNLDRILLVFDKTQASRSALNKAIDLSLEYGSELTLITTYEVPLEGFAYSPGLWEKEGQKVKRLQQQAKNIAEERGVKHLKTELRHGKAASEIGELAQKIDAGLIFMGCQPGQSVKKYLPGNVVEKVARNETNSVWISKS